MSTPVAAAGARALTPILVVLLLWLGVSGAFAVAQEIWVDETTQLSGITLGPFGVVSWLAGGENAFDVPGDRMPPISYWLGWLWSRVFGESENALRAMGIALVAAAAVFVMDAARRAFGGTAAWISGVAFVLSPNVIVAGVEIRAYPVLLLVASVAFWLVVRLSNENEARPQRLWTALYATCVIACYTHFFGLVLSGAVFLSLLSFPHVRKHALRHWLVGAGIIGVSALGLVPFAQAAVTISGDDSESKGLVSSAVRLVYRTLGGHPALGVYLPLLAAAMLGALATLASAVWPKRASRATYALLLAVASGFLVVTAAKAATGTFDALSASYNLWMLPAVFIAMGGVVALRGTRFGNLVWVAAGLLWLGNAGGALVLLSNRSTFAHTAAERSIERIEEAGPANVVVVHDGLGAWGHSYFPLRFTFGKTLKQYLAEPDAHAGLMLRELPDLKPTVAPSQLAGREVLWVTSRHQGANDLARYIQSDTAPKLTGGGPETSLTRTGYSVQRTETLVAQVASELVWMRRAQ